MGNRTSLDAVLRTLAPNVYFQAPEKMNISYPCIVYELSAIKPFFAGGQLYTYKKKYNVTVIDKNPDSLIPISILKLPLCSFDRFFVFDNLNHFTFSIYY